MKYDPSAAMTIRLDDELPEYPSFVPGCRRAPRREAHLTEADKALAIRNACATSRPSTTSRWRRSLPGAGRARPDLRLPLPPGGADLGQAHRRVQGKLRGGQGLPGDDRQQPGLRRGPLPYELVTYGETGQVCQNWMQYRLIKKYLEVMTDEQTPGGHVRPPPGAVPLHKLAPRCVITNGLMVGAFDDQKNFNRAALWGWPTTAR